MWFPEGLENTPFTSITEFISIDLIFVRINTTQWNQDCVYVLKKEGLNVVFFSKLKVLNCKGWIFYIYDTFLRIILSMYVALLQAIKWEGYQLLFKCQLLLYEN